MDLGRGRFDAIAPPADASPAPSEGCRRGVQGRDGGALAGEDAQHRQRAAPEDEGVRAGREGIECPPEGGRPDDGEGYRGDLEVLQEGATVFGKRKGMAGGSGGGEKRAKGGLGCGRSGSRRRGGILVSRWFAGAGCIFHRRATEPSPGPRRRRWSDAACHRHMLLLLATNLETPREETGVFSEWPQSWIMDG